MTPYAAAFPRLVEVTKNLDPVLLAHVGKHLDQYSIDVQIEYHAYLEFCREYEDWLDQNTKPNFVHDY